MRSLHDAAREGSLQDVERLLSGGADVNESNEYGETPLHLAARCGSLEVVKFLLENGASGDIAARDEDGRTPLHDGAIIVRGDRVVSATCYLPLTDNLQLSKDLGTRHRAAVGLSEVSDAIVIVVSEETGTISIVANGQIQRGFNAISASEELRKLLITNEERKNNIGLLAFFQKIRRPKMKEEKGGDGNEE